MIHLLHLRSIPTLSTHGNHSILFQSLILPNLFSWRFFLEGAHDIDVVGGRVDEGLRGDEDLIAPEDGETAGAGGGVDAGLADDCFEDGDGFVGAVGEFVADGEFHTRLIIILTRRQRSQPRSLPSSMIQRRRNLAPLQLARQIHIVLLLRDTTRLLKGIQRPESIPGARGGGPILGNGQHHGIAYCSTISIGSVAVLANALAQSVHPVSGLVIIRGANDGHVEEGGRGGGGHCRHGRFDDGGGCLGGGWVGSF
mmetsp:Transcript_8948/g.20137  ORF Transcript_8948/g.20137 Transcript_8948/m.20137 type:complete len:254 (+) Transcript_8948:949-1710(+)